MKFTCEIEINKPRETVITLFDNAENMKQWMPGLLSFEHLSGIPGQVGAKSKLKYDMNGRKIEMIETITVRNLPDEFSGTYEAAGVWNVVSNKFIAVSPDKTKWVSYNEFKFTNFMMKVMGFLMPGAFKKTSLNYLKLFKEFAEKS
ncbi:MAG: SRPBCC family protein [Fimbriimonadaceae bacterium]|nr:SRPBCC family protein [Chitinophagales bacterium]